jgi:hypothetical protein
MSVLKEVFNGYAQRIRLENSLQLQKQKLVRPPQIRLEVTMILKGINDELSDPVVKAMYDAVVLTVPE